MADVPYPEFMDKMRDLSKIYNNYTAILEKTDIDGYLSTIHTAITDILSNEIYFAFGGMIIRIAKDKWS